MPKSLSFPKDVVALVERRFVQKHRQWLIGDGDWPLSVPLGRLTEDDAAVDITRVRSWVDDWRAWVQPGVVAWETKHWPRVGTQQIPARLMFATAQDVATLVGQESRFKRAKSRAAQLVDRWPTLHGHKKIARHYASFADESDQDFERLVSLLAWLHDRPQAQLYMRQLPLGGLHTKWVETRTQLILDLAQASGLGRDAHDIYELCGFKREPYRVRLRVLCPLLRQAVGGLSDIEAPLDELSALPVKPSTALIVENLATGLALSDRPGWIVLMKLGNAVSRLREVDWLHNTNVLYWGDLDTHGFAILDQARQALPHLRSVLMDEDTLLAHQAFWTSEPVPHQAVSLPHLNDTERAVHHKLRTHAFGERVRLEQERLPWSEALARLEGVTEKCAGMPQNSVFDCAPQIPAPTETPL